MTTTPSLLLSVAQAAELLGIHQTTAHALIRRGEFPVPVRKVGASYKVSRHLLEQWCNDQQAQAS